MPSGSILIWQESRHKGRHAIHKLWAQKSLPARTKMSSLAHSQANFECSRPWPESQVRDVISDIPAVPGDQDSYQGSASLCTIRAYELVSDQLRWDLGQQSRC